MSTQSERAQALLQRHGRTFAAELGAPVRRNTPAPLFQLLYFSLLTSAPVQAGVAMNGARALRRAGWTTPDKLARSTWRERTDTLNRAGYARVDEKTASQLADFTRQVQDRYQGDLRRLRDEADGDAKKAKQALKRFTGVGDTGAAIFLREVQVAWPEFQPFIDPAAAGAARRLALPEDPRRLARLVPREQFPTLVAALVRVKLERDYQTVLDAA